MSTAQVRGRHRVGAPSPLKRELLVFGATLLLSLTVLPLVIWLAGRVFLGDYLRDYSENPELAHHGGPLAMLVDYFRGLAAGSPGHWVVLLGPYALLCLFRLGRRLT